MGERAHVMCESVGWMPMVAAGCLQGEGLLSVGSAWIPNPGKQLNPLR